MKVLCVICEDRWMYKSFVVGWQALGAEVEVFYYGKSISRSYFDLLSNKQVADTNKQLINRVEALSAAGGLDLIFFSILDDFISIKTLRKLQRFNIPLVNYHADMVALWYRSIKTAKYFSLFCCAQKYGMDFLQKTGARVLYLPMAANPYPEINITEREQFNGVTFLGAPIGYRPSVLAYLYYRDIPLRVYGHHWDWCPREYDPETARGRYFSQSMLGLSDKTIHDLANYLIPQIAYKPVQFAYNQFQKILGKYNERHFDVEEHYAHLPPEIILGDYPDQDFNKLVQSSSINLGFSHITGKEGSRYEMRQVRLRDFEIPLAGGFYLAQFSEELSELYIEGEHVEFWRTREELLKKVKYYLAYPESAKRIADSGYQYALQKHTWVNRFQVILDSIQ